MEFTEQQLMDTLGVKPKEEAPANTEEVRENTPAEQMEETEQSSEAQEQGNQNQQEADPQDADIEEDDEVTEDDGEGSEEPAQEEGQAPEKQPLTPEQRKQNAARRRKAERQQAIDEAVAQARQEEQNKASEEMKKFFKSAGLTNSFTKEPITSMEEFQSFQRQFDMENIKKQLAAGDLTPEMLDKLIEQNPVVQQAAAIVQNAETQQQEDAAFEQQVQFELQAIAKLDPEMTSLDAIKNSEKYSKDFEAGVMEGKSFLEAFTNARENYNVNRRASKQAQSIVRNNRGKSHLRASGSTGGPGAVSVSPDEMRMFKFMNPGATDAQIRDYVQKHRK